MLGAPLGHRLSCAPVDYSAQHSALHSVLVDWVETSLKSRYLCWPWTMVGFDVAEGNGTVFQIVGLWIKAQVLGWFRDALVWFCGTLERSVWSVIWGSLGHCGGSGWWEVVFKDQFLGILWHLCGDSVLIFLLGKPTVGEQGTDEASLTEFTSLQPSTQPGLVAHTQQDSASFLGKYKGEWDTFCWEILYHRLIS